MIVELKKKIRVINDQLHPEYYESAEHLKAEEYLKEIKAELVRLEGDIVKFTKQVDELQRDNDSLKITIDIVKDLMSHTAR